MHMTEKFPGTSPKSERLSPIEAAEPNKAKTEGIKRHVSELPEGTHLWNDLKRAEAKKAVSKFTLEEASRLIDISDEEKWGNNPAFYNALVLHIEEYKFGSGESQG